MHSTSFYLFSHHAATRYAMLEQHITSQHTTFSFAPCNTTSHNSYVVCGMRTVLHTTSTCTSQYRNHNHAAQKIIYPTSIYLSVLKYSIKSHIRQHCLTSPITLPEHHTAAQKKIFHIPLRCLKVPHHIT